MSSRSAAGPRNSFSAVFSALTVPGPWKQFDSVPKIITPFCSLQVKSVAEPEPVPALVPAPATV